VIAVSSPIRERILRWGVRPERVSVLLNAIDPDTFRRNPAARLEALRRWELPDDAVVVGSTGRLEQVKRFDILIEAFARLAAAVPTLRLVIAGDGTLRETLDTQARRLGVADRCRFPGHIADVRDAHAGFDVYVQSSESEGTPNAVLEAMAMETPLVATDVGGTRELAFPDEHGLLVPRNDAGALADAIRSVIEHPSAAAARTAAARRRVEDVLSFKARTAKLEDTYRDLAGRAVTGVKGRARA
jgi:glycosyltransferase involved in cell wall biosynthesis